MPFHYNEATKEAEYRDPECKDARGRLIKIGDSVRLSEEGKEAYNKGEMHLRFKLGLNDKMEDVPIKYRGKVVKISGERAIVLSDDYSDGDSDADHIYSNYLVIE